VRVTNEGNTLTSMAIKTHFVPYSLWSNRGSDEMRVWLPAGNVLAKASGD
jgi:hypothetical protein